MGAMLSLSISVGVSHDREPGMAWPVAMCSALSPRDPALSRVQPALHSARHAAAAPDTRPVHCPGDPPTHCPTPPASTPQSPRPTRLAAPHPSPRAYSTVPREAMLESVPSLRAVVSLPGPAPAPRQPAVRRSHPLSPQILAPHKPNPPRVGSHPCYLFPTQSSRPH